MAIDLTTLERAAIQSINAGMTTLSFSQLTDPATVIELVRRLRNAEARVVELEAERAEREKQKPVFWYRPRSDGLGYDGPIHDSQIEPVRRESGAWVPLYAGPLPSQSAAALVGLRGCNSTKKFNLGDLVRKKSGAEFEGRVVGEYSTGLTPEGYAVESIAHKYTVQIYPAAALELIQPAEAGG